MASNDIQAEVSREHGHAAIARTISDFLVATFGDNNGDRELASGAIAAAMKATGNLLAPVMPWRAIVV